MNISIRNYMGLISKYRGPIMGLCIAEVLFGHGGIVLPGPMNFFLKLIWVIDIFFFFTGLGVYHSMKKDGEIIPFYKRRFARIYPYYLPVVILYYLGQIICFRADMNVFQSVKEILGNLLMVGWINNLDRQFNWYPQAVFFAYLIAPILFIAVKSFTGSAKKMLLLLGFFIVTQPCFFGTNTLVGYSRAIAFVLGIIAADMADRDVDFKLNIPFMLVLAVVGLGICYWVQGLPVEISWPYGLSWYPGLLVIPGLMLVCCWFFSLVEKVKWLGWLGKLFAVLGACSFEIFIMQRLLYGFIDDFNIPVNGNLQWVIAAALIGLIAVGYSKLVKLVMKGMKKKAAA